MHCCRCLFQENRKLHREYDRYIEVFKKYRSHRNYTTLCQSWLSPGGGGRGEVLHIPLPSCGVSACPMVGGQLGGWGENHKVGGGEGNVPPRSPQDLEKGDSRGDRPARTQPWGQLPLSQFVPAHPNCNKRTGQAEISLCPSALFPPPGHIREGDTKAHGPGDSMGTPRTPPELLLRTPERRQWSGGSGLWYQGQ